MDDIVRCEKCGHDILEFKGKTVLAGIVFDCFTCEKCGNKMVLETKNEQNEQIESNSQKNKRILQ